MRLCLIVINNSILVVIFINVGAKECEFSFPNDDDDDDDKSYISRLTDSF